MDRNYNSITFDHFVEFKKDNCVFGKGREEGNKNARLFLIFNHTGRVYQRNGLKGSWELIDGSQEVVIRSKAAEAKDAGTPYYVSDTHFNN